MRNDIDVLEIPTGVERRAVQGKGIHGPIKIGIEIRDRVGLSINGKKVVAHLGIDVRERTSDE